MKNKLNLHTVIDKLLSHLVEITRLKLPLDQIDELIVADIDCYLDWLLDNQYYELHDKFSQLFKHVFENNYHLTVVLMN